MDNEEPTSSSFSSFQKRRIEELQKENEILMKRVLELEEQAIRQEQVKENSDEKEGHGNDDDDDDDNINNIDSKNGGGSGDDNNDAHHDRGQRPESLQLEEEKDQRPYGNQNRGEDTIGISGTSSGTSSSTEKHSSIPIEADTSQITQQDQNQQRQQDSTNSVTFQSELTPHQIERYSRQLLLPSNVSFLGGVSGQKSLLSSRVLVIGAGGIGSTVILYLGACGVGQLSIMDFDTVEMSNLHRQIIHKSTNAGKMNKSKSAQRAVLELNPTIDCTAIEEPLTPSNAIDIISRHDVVVDASDNPQTRYLVNDACVLAGKTLVSGSAIGLEGQLSVYNYFPPAIQQQQQSCTGSATSSSSSRGPCYRCLYPTPNLTEGSKSCSDNGVLGPVPGLIGILQAIETMKVLTSSTKRTAAAVVVGDDDDNGDSIQFIGSGVLYDRLLMYDATQCSFLKIKKPPRRKNCPVCGINPTITSMDESYDACKIARGPSCGIVHTTTPGDSNQLKNQSWDVTCEEYNSVRRMNVPHILLDVRVKEQFDLCSLPGAINIPLDQLEERIDDVIKLATTTGAAGAADTHHGQQHKPIYCMCRRGIASVAATNLLNEKLLGNDQKVEVKNIHGGLNMWRSQIDNSFPNY